MAHEIELTPLEMRLFDKHTEKRPVVVKGEPDAHTVWLKAGGQSFALTKYCDTADEADWMRAMLAKALGAIHS